MMMTMATMMEVTILIVKVSQMMKKKKLRLTLETEITATKKAKRAAWQTVQQSKYYRSNRA